MYKTARHSAYLMLSCKCCLYSQWFPGEEHQVTDSSSRDFHLSDFELTNLITSFLPDQVPFGFHLCPLPTEINSWLISLLQNQPCKEQWSKQPTQSKLSLGLAINATFNQSGSSMTGTWVTSTDTKNIRSSVPFAIQSTKVDFLLSNTELIKLDKFDPPSTMWYRPTSWLTDQTPVLIQITNLHSFYSEKSKDIKNTDIQ